MHVSSDSHIPLQYSCQQGNHKTGKCQGYNTIVVRKVDNEVWAEVCKMIRDPKKMEEKINALKTSDPTEDERPPIQIRIQKVEEEIENLVETTKTAKSDIAKKISRHLLLNLRVNW